MKMSRYLIASAVLGLSMLTAAGVQAVPTALPASNAVTTTVSAGGWTVVFNADHPLNVCALNTGSGATNNCSPDGVTASVGCSQDCALGREEGMGPTAHSLTSIRASTALRGASQSSSTTRTS